ncbi:MAG TPA: DUF177 domain-containing protein [Vicinamibacterales bacterium]|nr:DUF177 domain-containing protein [Vicinamibacterales bacterium]
MRLELSHFRQPETEYHKVLQPAEVTAEGEDYRVTAPVDLRMTIHKDHDRYRLVGTVKTALELQCSRCLEPFALPVDREFDLRFLPHGAAEAEADDDEETEVEDDVVAVTFYRDEAIDLNELLREQFYLALPMKPLHAEDCKGICPQCGTNRNINPCTCSPQWEDPRLAGLKTLLKRKDDA